MEEQEELWKLAVIELWYSLGQCIPKDNHEFAKLIIEKSLLKTIHKAYILGGQECLKTLKGNQ